MQESRDTERRSHEFSGEPLARKLIEWLNSPLRNTAQDRIGKMLRNYLQLRKSWEVVRTPGEIHARMTQPYNTYQAEIERLRRQLRRYTFYPMFYPVCSWTSIKWLPTPRAKKYVRGWEEEYDDTRAVFDIAQLAAAGFLDQLLTCRCGNWFFAKFKHQQFCSTKCRQQEFRTSERWKEYRRRKAREYYRLHRSGKVR